MVNGLGIISGEGLNGIHQPFMVSNEWGQRWNFFKLRLYASKFDMVRLGTFLDSMRGF